MTPEPQGPTTGSGLPDLWRWYDEAQSPTRRAEIRLAIETEARAAAPPDIDVERLERWERGLAAMYRHNYLVIAELCDEYLDPSGALLGRVRRLASPDATRREPSGE